MAVQWEDRSPMRPERYLDWEVYNTTANAVGLLPTRWCSVLVQVQAGPAGTPAKHLEALQQEVQSQPPLGPFTIKMHAEEKHLLDLRILEVKGGQYVPTGADDVGLEFFIYLPESLAYQAGEFAHKTHYKIRLVGPPITDLNFDVPVARQTPSSAMIAYSAQVRQRVAIGIIDDGIAFANERFRNRMTDFGPVKDQTRISKIWLQDVETRAPNNSVAFGKRISRSEINSMLDASSLATGHIREAEVYRRAGMLDFSKSGTKAVGRRAAHGTHVMDLACGFEPSNPSGLDRPILAVQLPDAATADTSGVTMGSYVLQGLRQIMLWADQIEPGSRPLPLVVNFSYGIYAGPKDGTHPLEIEIGRLVAHRNLTTPTAVVLPAGNGYLSRSVAKMDLEANASESLEWIIQPDDSTPNYLEIWFDERQTGSDTSPLEVHVSPPIGPSGPPSMPQRAKAKVVADSGKPIFGVYYDRTNASGRLRGRILITVNQTKSLERKVATAAAGAWKLTVKNVSGAKISPVLYVQRDDTPAGYRLRGRQSYFEHAHAHERNPATGSYDALGRACVVTPSETLSAISTGKETIVVGAALADIPPFPSEYSASGPTKGRAAPDCSAVGDDGVSFPGVFAAGTASGTMVALRGSSVASPQVARELADAGADVSVFLARFPAASDPRLGRGTLPVRRSKDVPERRN